MTTRYPEKIKCYVCNSENEYFVLGSTNALGSADLDTRPPEMKRSTMDTWVQRCPSCGYCTADISHGVDIASAAINGAEYKSQLNNTEYTEIANSFLCSSIIQRKVQNYAQAAWSCIHAAWCCDDTGHVELAKNCRVMAVNFIRLAEENGQPISQQKDANIAILVDLLRRAGQFQETANLIDEKDEIIQDVFIRRILDYQRVLISKLDIDCHTVSFFEEMSKNGAREDEIPWGIEEFGLEVTNPVPTAFVSGIEGYLKKLRKQDGGIIKSHRMGTTYADNIDHSIDIYEIMDEDDTLLAKIYLSPYHKKTSTKAPRGFKLRKYEDSR
jgi:hypothetical protein